MSNPVLMLLDQDCSRFVTTWGTLQVVRKLKLSDSTLFSSQFRITLDNTLGTFTPGGAGSMFPKVGWAGGSMSITKDGLSLYEGFIWDLQADDESSTVTLEFTTDMTAAADVVANLVGTGLNPANACRSLLEQAGLRDVLNQASFSVAAGYFRGHTIDVNSPPLEGETCLSLASSISDICSMDFILVRGQVYCVVQKPWDGSGLRQEINGDNCRSFSQMKSDAANFANRVEFSYGAQLVITVDNANSQRAERRIISTPVDATDEAKVKVTTAASARFFANLLLQRVSPRRFLLNCLLGPDFTEVLPAWRFPVTYADLGLDFSPFEVNEIQLDLDTDETTTTLQSLEAA